MTQPNKTNPKRRRLIVAIAVVAVLVAGYLLFGRSKSITLTGVVTTDAVIVSPQVQGRLKELLVKEGDTVTAGQVIGTIDADESQADLAFYQSSESQAAARVSESEANLKFQEALSESQIRQAEATSAGAQAGVTAAESEAENARLTFTRLDELHRTGAESGQAYDQARTASAAAQARLETARGAAAAAQAAIAVAQANREQVAAKRASLQADRDLLAAATAQKQKATARLGYTEIRAPIAGIVDVRAARAGEIVGPGQPIVTLVNPDDLWVRVDVEESYIEQMPLGATMPVRLPSGETRDGKVFFRGVDADYATQRDVNRTKRDIKTFEIRLRCDNQDRRLAVGLTAYVTLPLPSP